MENLMSISELDIDEYGLIERIDLDGPIHKRVCDIGFLPGVKIKCLQKAPAGSPIAYLIKGTVIALRKNDAELIMCKTQGGNR